MTPATMTTDIIERSITLAFPQHRVWKALTTAREFSSWFGMALDGEFTAGQPIAASFESKTFGHVHFELLIDEITPETLFSWRWHPYALDSGVDYSAEPYTQVTFTLDAAENGTVLRVVESGFEGIPAGRRPLAFDMNTRGWESQIANIAKYLTAQG